MINTLQSFTHKISFFVMLVLYRILLDFSYVNFVSEVFAYEGYIYSFSLSQYIFSLLIFSFSIFIIKDRIALPSHYFFLIAIILVYTPLTSIYGLNENYRMEPVLVSFFSILFIRIILLKNIIKPFNFVHLKNSESILFYLSVISIFILIFWYIISGAVKYFNLDISKVYDYRIVSSEIANVGFMSYFNGWVYKVFVVFLISYFLYLKKYLYVFLVILCQIFFFGVNAHKTVLFTPFIVLFIWFYFRKYNSALFVLLLLNFILLLCLYYYYFNDNIVLGSMFVRRAFILPAKLTFDYFDFFSQNPKIFWSNSILSWLFDYPYNDRVTKIVSGEQDSNASANTGYIASGFYNFGIFGVAIYTFIISVLLRNIDYLYKSGIPLWFILCLIVNPVQGFLLSSDLLTTLLTHGLLLAIILLIFSRKIFLARTE